MPIIPLPLRILGKTITVVAGYTDGGSTAESVTSTATPSGKYTFIKRHQLSRAQINLWFDNQAEANATYGHIKDWNVSAVTYMANAFKDRTNFNEDISDWDISNAISTYRMFYGASTFNQNISNWNVGNVTDMQSMFQNASAFNQPIGDWNVSKVQLMFGIFAGASTFNQSIGDWNTTSVTNLHNAFNGATAFNQPLNNWNTSAVTTFYGIFGGTSNFNQPLEKWDTSSVNQFTHAFTGASSFNQDISDWNISNAIGMIDMFKNANFLSNTNKGLIHSSFSSIQTGPTTGPRSSTTLPTDLNSTAPLTIGGENMPIGNNPWGVQYPPTRMGMRLPIPSVLMIGKHIIIYLVLIRTEH